MNGFQIRELHEIWTLEGSHNNAEKEHYKCEKGALLEGSSKDLEELLN